MPRRKYKHIDRVSVDSKYHDHLVGLTINYILRQGKKSKAESMMYEAMDIIGKKTGKNPVDVYYAAVKNVAPSVQVKSRRVGGATYQVPIEIQQDRGRTLAVRWLLDFARGRKGAPFAVRLSEEIMEAADNKGGAIKKKQDTHKMAEANKAFSHYRF
jgi:small subunit ribosomal protein S7